ncbi:hypothetical protein SLS57_006179 [Botryosphaeria dothidea]
MQLHLILTTLILSICSAAERPHFSLKELYKLQESIWENFIAPNNAIQAESVNSSLLTPDIRGRVDITREFIGAELNTEYLFGLFAQIEETNEYSLLGVPVAYDMVSFTGNQDVANAVTLIHFNSTVWGPFTLEVHVRSKFNVRGQLMQYDATFRQWDLFLEEGYQRIAATQFGGSIQRARRFITDQIAKTVCQVHEQSCDGENRQWKDKKECYRFLVHEIPFGAGHAMGRNNLICRMMHTSMVPIRPATHCPHIGPTGGGMCDNKESYADRINQDFWKYSWTPEALE